MMTDATMYPQLMQPHELKKLNDKAVKKLGTPIFFAAVEPSRPRTQSASGRLYEVVTGLYVIYKDYGMQIFQTFLDFCKDNIKGQDSTGQFFMGESWPFFHINDIKNLRGGLCHGNFVGGDGTQLLGRSMAFYLSQTDLGIWPDYMLRLSDQDCQKIVRKITRRSNELVDYLQKCIDWLALPENQTILSQWRKTLVEDAMNPKIKKYSRGKYFFDERIIMQFERPIRGYEEQKNHAMVIQQWLQKLASHIENGTLRDSDELQQTLIQVLDNLYHPTTLYNSISSADILLKDLEI